MNGMTQYIIVIIIIVENRGMRVNMNKTKVMISGE